MAVNLDKPEKWKSDIEKSVDMYNNWFMEFAPKTFINTRKKTTKKVKIALQNTGNLTNIEPDVFRKHPNVLSTLRMSTCPPLAVDRLVGLSGVSSNLVNRLEQDKLPTKMQNSELDMQLTNIAKIIKKLTDPYIFPWIKRHKPPTRQEINRAAAIVADRLCGNISNPIIRNAQERRQLTNIENWMKARDYKKLPTQYSDALFRYAARHVLISHKRSCKE